VAGAARRVRLLGSLQVWSDGVEVPLPPSRKVRALLAYLAVAPSPVARSQLCDLLWDGPDDPRAELRWCLSKIRRVLDDPDRKRVQARAETVALDLSDCFVDARGVLGYDAIEGEDLARLRVTESLFAGEFAEGLEIDPTPQFAGWLASQRRQFRAARVAVLERLVERLAADPAAQLEYLDKWLQLSPFDTRTHHALLGALHRCGRIQEAEEHLAATIRAYEEEGLNWGPMRERWRAFRAASAQESFPVRVAAETNAGQAASGGDDVASEARRAAICVMPFIDKSSAGTARGGLGDGLTEDIITRLAQLRVLRVIARGTVYALGERNVTPGEAGRLLNVDYVASGSVRRKDNRVTVAVELAETRSARIVWTEEFACQADDIPLVPEDVVSRIVATIAEEVEAAERNRAMLKPVHSLDGWEAYHRGLWHMYRFNERDNDGAAHFFELAVKHDPTFARAYAALSFTHFQNAFLHRPARRQEYIDMSFEVACLSLAADDRDPAAHLAMGRALWLNGREEESLLELGRSVALSPNFALGHYTLGFVQCQSGDPVEAIAATDCSRELSPFDPLTFAMLASRAIAHLRLGQHEEAAEWAAKGAIRQNAHAHAIAIAAACGAIAGRSEQSQRFVESLRRRAPGYRVDDLLSAFRLPQDINEMLRGHAHRIDLS
jgi:DNA-binding SARP family transcriptional activator